MLLLWLYCCPANAAGHCGSGRTLLPAAASYVSELLERWKTWLT
jgi:hypothetical protein